MKYIKIFAKNLVFFQKNLTKLQKIFMLYFVIKILKCEVFMAENLTAEKLEKALDKAITQLPQNIIKNNIPLIQKAIDSGLTLKQVAVVLEENFEIKVKASQVKKSFLEAGGKLPEKKGKGKNPEGK